ncbi:MAG TPA: fibronectin type III domain-containing protein [Thermoanaerobaculia bacterium]|nr:fibronectin type III domain-containing protein [Thermoanaerobaculia bacterium]
MKAVVRLLSLLAVVLLALPAAATSFVMTSDEVLLEDSTGVVQARVLSVDSAPGRGLPATDYMIEVDRVVAGEVSGRNLIVRVPGGTRPDGSGWMVWGMPQMRLGERVLLFLRPRNDGTYSVTHLMLGAFHEVLLDGKPVLVRELAGAQELTPAGVEPGSRAHLRQPRDARAFTRWLEEADRGRVRPADYFVAVDGEQAAELVTGEYKLFTSSRDGLNMRWFEFDSGATVDWRIHQSGQDGYTLAETIDAMRDGIAVWNNDRATNINYRYVGTTSSTDAFQGCSTPNDNDLCLDGINSVIFDDADGSVGTPFNCGGFGSGTLAVGGPIFENSVIPGPGGKNYHPTLEAEVVLNEDIECLLTQGSNDRPALAQLLGHELGHTLGITHPCEGAGCGNEVEQEAMMYPFFHQDGRGAVLNADDRAAARALYPASGGNTGGGARPAAPTDLVAVVVSPTAVQLTWQDNADNETTYRAQWRTGTQTTFQTETLPADSTSALIEGLLPNTTYVFRVEARNASGGTASSQVTVATPAALPAAPGNLAAVALSSNSVGLTWEDLSDNETGFQVEMRSPSTPGWVAIATVPANTESFTIPGLDPGTPYTFRVSAFNTEGSSPVSDESSATPLTAPAECVADAETLCLLDRFEVSVTWKNQHAGGTVGTGQAAPFPGSDRTGTFWFFNPANVELIVKVLDGSTVNDFYWVFYGSLSNVEYWITVVDVELGNTITYHNPPGERCGQFDTAALPDEPVEVDSTAAVAELASLLAPATAVTGAAGTCTPDAETLCLLDGRFAVSVDWTNQGNGESGDGQAVPGTDQTGYFWFFNPANIELVVKVLDSPATNSYWFFYGSLSDREYQISVTDTVSGETKTYHNAPGNRCGQFDTDAFPR